MNLGDLINAMGDDVQFQNLDQATITLNYSAKSGSKITFGTEQPITPQGTERIGLIVWLDRKKVNDALAKARGSAAA